MELFLPIFLRLSLQFPPFNPLPFPSYHLSALIKYLARALPNPSFVRILFVSLLLDAASALLRAAKAPLFSFPLTRVRDLASFRSLGTVWLLAFSCLLGDFLGFGLAMKRLLGGEGEDGNGLVEPRLKRPRPMISAMREVMGVQCVRKNLPKLEPFLRRVVQEEVGNALCRFVQSTPRVTINHIQEGASKQYQLQFENSLPHTLFTGSRIEAEGKVPVQIAIKDTESKKRITSGPLSSSKVEILVIDGDFGGDDQVDWKEKEFGDSIVREREGKRPLLTGELMITLNNGVGCLGDAAFTDNSSWIRSRKFRLGARLLQNRCTEVSVQEAISGPFFVKDHRGELYKKHHPPSLDDEVWRLEKIGKDGAFHRRLADHGIDSVQDFLKSLVMDQERLRNLLGSGMSNKMWEATLEHAKECVLNDKYYSYCNGQGVILLFNCIFELVGAMFDHDYHPLDDLNASQKITANKLRQLAYKNPGEMIELKLPEIESLPRFLPASDVISGPQASCSEPLNQLQDESASHVSIARQTPTPCSELLDPSQLKDYFTGHGLHWLQNLGPSETNTFDVRDFRDMQLGYHHAEYNAKIDAPNPFSPLPIWDDGNGFIHASGADPGGGLLNGLQISPGKWVKLVAALKWMAVSKHLPVNVVE